MRYFLFVIVLFSIFSCAKDKTPPVINSITFESDKKPPEFNRGEKIIFSFEATDNKGLRRYMTEVYRQTSLVLPSALYYFENSGATNIEVSGETLDLPATMDTGLYLFRLIVVDGNDNFADHFDTIKIVGNTIYPPQISFENAPPENTEFTNGEEISFSGTAQSHSSNLENVTVFLVKDTNNLTNDDITEDNSIVLYKKVSFENGEELTFEGSITVGTPTDNNTPPGLIDNWNLGNAFLLAKAVNENGFTGYSLRRYIKVNSK